MSRSPAKTPRIEDDVPLIALRDCMTKAGHALSIDRLTAMYNAHKYEMLKLSDEQILSIVLSMPPSVAWMTCQASERMTNVCGSSPQAQAIPNVMFNATMTILLWFMLKSDGEAFYLVVETESNERLLFRKEGNSTGSVTWLRLVKGTPSERFTSLNLFLFLLNRGYIMPGTRFRAFDMTPTTDIGPPFVNLADREIGTQLSWVSDDPDLNLKEFVLTNEALLA